VSGRLAKGILGEQDDGFSQRPAERNRPATFEHPLSSWWADQKIALMLAGKMGDEVRRCTAGN